MFFCEKNRLKNSDPWATNRGFTVCDIFRYEKQSRRLASIINNYPEQPKDTLVKYVELAAQYPEIGQHLQLAGANMNWFVYSSLDVILFLIFALLAFTLFTMLIFRLPKYLLDRSKEEDVYDEDTKEKEQ
jgi:hypothetical protein